MRICKIVSLALFIPLAPLHAETITAKRISSVIKLIPLKKMTVGPDDQYHGWIHPSGDQLVFTRKSDLAPHICSQNIQSGEVTEILPLSADSEEPSFSPEGELAFTYYQFHATGDICRKKSATKDAPVTCLKIENGEPSSPFWKSSKELGYLLKDSWTQNSRLIVENLETGKKEVLAEGNIWSPAMKAGGKYLFYNAMVDLQRVLVAKHLPTGKIKIIRFSLPGISGFPAVSDDEQYLYFSHYLNDTNNDNVIDGNDNSVIFRAPIQRLFPNESFHSDNSGLTQPPSPQDEFFPEQLTSVDSNCSFPRPYQNEIYATCAFEGALDLYQLPTTGIVPSQWDEATLHNAHQTARSYSDRLLILNTLKYRFPSPSRTSLENRILNNHLLADDLASSKYYLGRLTATAAPEQKPFYTLLNLYLEAREKKKIQKSNEVTPSLERAILEIHSKMDTVHGYTRFKKILKGLLHTLLNQPEKSAAFLRDVHFDSTTLPLERYFYFELARWTLPRVEKSGSNLKWTSQTSKELEAIYFQMMSAPELSEESHIYYAFHYLTELGLGRENIQTRISRVLKMNHNLPSPISSLLKSEAISLNLIQAKNDQAKSNTYRELDQLMSVTRDNYFLRKAMYIRSILNFAEAQEFRYLDFVATTWLRYTRNDDTEFASAREVYAIANLDQAYGALGQKNPSLASNYFFGSLTLTDDLESHFGYIQAKVATQQRALLDERYKNLKLHQQIEDHLKYVEALLILIDAHPSSETDVKHLDLALEKLRSMEQDRDSAVRYLLMGYCSLEKLLKLGAGYELPQSLFESAHRDLMLAYDQGLDHVRIKASALMNLGLLHQRALNHGLAAKFFAKRKLFGFVSEDETIRFAWLYARSLFYNHQPQQASLEIQSVLKPHLPARISIPLQERLAFYLQSAGQYSEAARIYSSILSHSHPSPMSNKSKEAASATGELETNFAKIYLSYGYTLFKLKQNDEAKIALTRSLEYAESLKFIPKGKTRWIDFQPVRLKLIGYGLLSQIGTPTQRLEALHKRQNLLKEAQDLLDQWDATDVQTQHQIAYLIHQTDPAKAAHLLQGTLPGIEKFGELNQYLPYGVYHATVDILAHAILQPSLYRDADSKRLQNIVDKTILAYTFQENSQPILTYQKLKLQLLWTAYSFRVVRSSSSQEVSKEFKQGLNQELTHELNQELKKITESDSFTELKESLPEKWNELRTLVSALESTKT